MEKIIKRRPKKVFVVLFILLLTISSILLYARFIATSGIKIKEYKITNTKITNNFHGFKIAHISDIHYGRITFKNDLKKIVDKINLTKPDIVVLTGDLIDRSTKLTSKMTDDISEVLNSINANIGKYAITGNHDYNFKSWESIIVDGGFINLNDTYELIYKEGLSPILISGLSTNMHGQTTINEKIKPTMDYLNNVIVNEENSIINSESIYNILLIHEPDFIDNINKNKFDLILSGHTHNGQVRLPFIGAIILPENGKKYYKEHYSIENLELYISSGIGVSTMNFRLFNRPSFNLYRLTNK